MEPKRGRSKPSALARFPNPKSPSVATPPSTRRPSPTARSNLSWEGTGTLQESIDLINWTNSANQANPQTVAPEGTIKAYRILVSP